MSNIEYIDILKNGALFRNISDEEMPEIIRVMHPVRRVYQKGCIIAYEGDQVNELGAVISGKVHLIRDTVNGKTTLLDTRSPGEYTGLLNIAGDYKLRFNIKAVEDTEILYLHISPILNKHVLPFELQLKFMQNFSAAIAKYAKRLNCKLESSVRCSTRDKLKYYLSDYAKKAGSRTFTIPLSRQELADCLFVDRSAMSNELCKMRDEGLLRFNRNHFELLVDMPVADDEYEF